MQAFRPAALHPSAHLASGRGASELQGQGQGHAGMRSAEGPGVIHAGCMAPSGHGSGQAHQAVFRVYGPPHLRPARAVKCRRAPGRAGRARGEGGAEGAVGAPPGVFPPGCRPGLCRRRSRSPPYRTRRRQSRAGAPRGPPAACARGTPPEGPPDGCAPPPPTLPHAPTPPPEGPQGAPGGAVRRPRRRELPITRGPELRKRRLSHAAAVPDWPSREPPFYRKRWMHPCCCAFQGCDQGASALTVPAVQKRPGRAVGWREAHGARPRLHVHRHNGTHIPPLCAYHHPVPCRQHAAPCLPWQHPCTGDRSCHSIKAIQIQIWIRTSTDVHPRKATLTGASRRAC